MLNGVRIKVCGLTSISDAEAADAAGADYLGFIFHAKSPRHVPLEQFKAMRGRLPPRKTVAVMVEPTLTDVGQVIAAGAHMLQVHFDAARWQEFTPWLLETVGFDRVWLAPRTPNPASLPEEFLRLGKYFLIDAFAADKFGGTGHTGDWEGFAQLRKGRHGKSFILSGGLRPENVGAALAATNAKWLDVNSGVEAAPGLKDPAKIRAFFEAVRAATQPK